MTDYAIGATIYIKFTTRAFATGIPTTLAGTPVLSAYEDDSVTQITAGVSITVDLDGVTGLNLATIVATTGNGFEDGKQYGIVITTGTVAGVSVVGEVVGQFTIGVVADSVWDEVLTGATHNIATSAGRRLRTLQDFGVYEGGAVWVDTINGTAGTTDFENGTVSNPVDTIADARTIADSVGLKVFHVLPGSSFTLAQAFDGFEFVGYGYTVALGGQSVSGSLFENATINGNDDGSNALATSYRNCKMGTNTLGLHRLDSCGLSTTVTLAEAGTYDWVRCHSRVAGTGTPVVNFGAAVGNTNLNMRAYSGGIQIEAMGDTGTDTMSLEGNGQIIEGTCTGGTVAIRGNFTTSGITNLTLSDNARIDTDQINAAVLTAQMTESYAANGVAPTLAQALFAIHQNGMQFGISGTSKTVRKLDDSTTAFVITHDSASAPTDAKRV